MKNVVLLLSFLFISLFVSNAMNDALFPDMDGVEEYAQASGFEVCVDNTTGYIVPASTAASDSDKTFADAQSLAGQLRLACRTQRTVNLQTSFLTRAMLSRTAVLPSKDCLSSLNSYTSIPRRSWEVSSEHYIFEMRRILI